MVEAEADALPMVSIIVPTYNRAHFIERSFLSLVQQNYPTSRYEIIVIDDGSSDNTTDILNRFSREYDNFRFIGQSNKGPATARNSGLHEATGEFILFIDDDCIADRNWIRELTVAYRDPAIGGVAGHIRYIAPANNVANQCAKLLAGNGQLTDASGKVSLFVTANASFRRSVLLDCGGFDVSFPFAAQEDFDLSVRVMKKGWKLAYSESALVDHYHHHTVLGDVKRWFRVGESEVLICRKHNIQLSIWIAFAKSIVCFYRVPFGMMRNFLSSKRSLAGCIAPLVYRLNQFILSTGRIRGYMKYRNSFDQLSGG
jgi:cellulose synthase/poly-beta-1,6-N-acetylglucosamine synthase-like glycosyltransferase